MLAILGQLFQKSLFSPLPCHFRWQTGLHKSDSRSTSWFIVDKRLLDVWVKVVFSYMVQLSWYIVSQYSVPMAAHFTDEVSETHRNQGQVNDLP